MTESGKKLLATTIVIIAILLGYIATTGNNPFTNNSLPLPSSQEIQTAKTNGNPLDSEAGNTKAEEILNTSS